MRVSIYSISSQYFPVIVVPGEPGVVCWLLCSVPALVADDPAVPDVVPSVGPDDLGVPGVVP
jgi:hypothetical protein